MPPSFTHTPLLVSIVVPCRNEVGYIDLFFNSILRQERSHFELEVLIADGMSTDGTRDRLELLRRKHPVLRVVDNPGRIVSTGLNAAIREARGEIVIRMDVHTEYATDYVAQCLRALSQSGADNVGGPWVAVGRGYISGAIALAFQTPFATGGGKAHDPTYEGPVDTVYLGCWHRSLLDRIGLFDEQLVRNQDDEFNLRLHRAGGVIWQSPLIRSWYTPRSSLTALFRQYVQYGYWKVRVIQKHRLPASIRHIVPGAFVSALGLFGLVSLVWTPALWALLALFTVYTIATATATVRVAASRNHWRYIPILPVVYAAFHFGYGYGFAAGVFDFVLRRKGASTTFTTLTRGGG